MEGVIGFVTLFAGNFAPKDWAFCQGQLISIPSNTALFSILGTTYGGDGRTTFALPDLRGRCVLGAGQSPGGSQYFEGEVGGSFTTYMFLNQMPAHTHQANMTIIPHAAASADQVSPVNAVYATPSSGDQLYGSAPSGQSLPYPGTMSTGNTGFASPINIQDPILALNYIICLAGLFPSRP